MSGRTSKKEDTHKRSLRDELIAAGLEFLNHNRIEDLTMRKLASLCNVTPHAIYNHFADKDALIEALGNDILSDLTQTATEIMLQSSLNFEGKMIALTNAYFDLIEKYPFRWQITQKVRSSSSPSYIIEQTRDRLVCKNKYPGFPSLKTLNRFSKLPAPIIDALMKKKDFTDRLFTKHPTNLKPVEDDPETCLGQIMLYSLVVGLAFSLANGNVSSSKSREEEIQELIHYLFKRYF